MRLGRCLILATCLAYGCERHEKAERQGRDASVTEVSVTHPVRQTLHYVVDQPGRIEPFEQTPIYARVSGYVRTVRVEHGDRVKKGDVLAEVDVPELVEEHHRKEAMIIQVRAGITQAEQAERVAQASLASMRADLEIARAAALKAVAALDRWRSEYQRMERLVKDKVVDQQNVDEARNQLQAAESAKGEADARIVSAQAAINEAQARCNKARADREAVTSQLRVAQADERQVNAMVNFATITAPYDGVVTSRVVHTGHLVQASTGAARGDPLFTIVRMDKIRVFVEVPEVDAVLVHEGSPGRIRVQVLNDREFVGKVAGTSWSLDPSQRTLRTEIDFPNPEGILRPGMYVHALLDLDRPSSWVVPAGTVLVRDGLTFCYKVQNGRTERLPLRTGLRSGGLIEIRKVQVPPARPGDLPTWADPNGEEAIVVSKPGELIDNQQVKIVPAKESGQKK